LFLRSLRFAESYQRKLRIDRLNGRIQYLAYLSGNQALSFKLSPAASALREMPGDRPALDSAQTVVQI
jgi:hypothetical protein